MYVSICLYLYAHLYIFCCLWDDSLNMHGYNLIVTIPDITQMVISKQYLVLGSRFSIEKALKTGFSGVIIHNVVISIEKDDAAKPRHTISARHQTPEGHALSHSQWWIVSRYSGMSDRIITEPFCVSDVVLNGPNKNTTYAYVTVLKRNKCIACNMPTLPNVEFNSSSYCRDQFWIHVKRSSNFENFSRMHGELDFKRSKILLRSTLINTHTPNFINSV